MHKQLLILFPLLALLLAPAASAEEEFLKPDQAFVISAGPASDGKVQVRWDIADGYYMYQSKFRFFADAPGVELGEPELPPSITKEDPIFGKVETYRGPIAIGIPLLKTPAGLDVLTLRTRSQGCADAGICYPPHTQTVLVALDGNADAPPPVDPNRVENLAVQGSGPAIDESPAREPGLPSIEQQIGGDDPLPELAELGEQLGLGGMDDDGILPPEEAFRVSAESLDGKRLKVQWRIAEGTYLYQDKVRLELAGEGVTLGTYELPPPDIKKDSIKPDGSIGDVAVYHDLIDLDIPLVRSNTGATEITLTAKYQGCADRGICYPPQKTDIRIALPAGTGSAAEPAAQTPSAPTVAAPGGGPAAPAGSQDAILGELAAASPMAVLGLSLFFGILVAFTACMYPMIPILSSLIMGHGHKVTPFKAFSLSLSYTQGIALTFGVLGAIFAFAGEAMGIQGAMQTPWILVPSALLFVALAMSMFGFYEIQVPSAIQSMLNAKSNEQKGGSLLGVGLMGVISALIVGPCGGPILLAVLLFAAQSGDVINGFILLWVFGTGMGLPLLVLGSGGGALLPKAGTWMDAVKATGGIIMLALAISFLERLSPTYIPTTAIMLMWGTLLIVTSVYMGAFTPLDATTTGWRKLWKGLGVLILIYGATFLLGVSAGGKDTLQPLRGVVSAGGHGATQAEHPVFKRVKSVADLQREVAAASAAGRPVMLDFYADWCTYCKTMEREVFPAPAVRKALADFVLLQADITANDEQDTVLQKHLGLIAPPALYFWNRQGEELRNSRLVGNMTAPELAAHIARIYP